MIKIEKLVKQLRHCAELAAYYDGDYNGIYNQAADALEELQARCKDMDCQLEEFSRFLCNQTGGLLSKTNYSAETMIAYAEDYQQRVCDNYCDLRADLARVTAERDAIERDFRAFTKQWWEEANGFPCRFCKFEKSGGCEQKGKHPDDEKPCAGRWFEWRGIKED